MRLCIPSSWATGGWGWGEKLDPTGRILALDPESQWGHTLWLHLWISHPMLQPNSVTYNYITLKKIVSDSLMISGLCSSVSHTITPVSHMPAPRKLAFLLWTSVKIRRGATEEPKFLSPAYFLQIILHKWGTEQGFRKWSIKPELDSQGLAVRQNPMHLNSSKLAICYPLSFSGIDEQVVCRRSPSIFSFWNLSNSRSDWLFLPHDKLGAPAPRWLLPGRLRRGEWGEDLLLARVIRIARR